MNYSVSTHESREAFQLFLNELRPNQKLHSFEFLGPQVLAVYVTYPVSPALLTAHKP